MATNTTDAQDPTVVRIKECLADADVSHYEAAKLMKELEGRSWNQRRIAQAVGVSQSTVSQHVRWYELDEPRPAYGGRLGREDDQLSGSQSEDQQDEDDDQLPDVPDVDDLTEDEIREAEDQFKAENPSTGPLDNYTDEKALRDSVGTFARVLTEMASIVTDDTARQKLRQSLVQEIERILA